MQLNLRELHRDIRKHNKTYDVFTYVYNKIEFNVMFDICHTPYRLVFIKKRSELFLVLEVYKGFIINTYLDDRLSTLKNMLELNNGHTKFSTNKFFEEFNKKIPINISNQKVSLRTISKVYNCEESDKIYIKEMRDWSKSPHLNKHVTAENREKTRLLYPEIYEEIKEKNISVFYTDKKVDTY